MSSRQREIWVAGYPSFFGGADTELDHNIDLWRSNDVAVNLVPMFGSDPEMRRLCHLRGCKTHEYRPGIFKDKVLTSFCNGEFLKLLPKIVEEGKPRRLIWFNCMTWLFDDEKTAHKNGWIDFHGFNSTYQRGWLRPELEQIRAVQELDGYRPYFNPESASQQLRFQYREPHEFFALGRISRDDSGKYSSDMWSIFNKVCAPRPTKVFVLGFGPNAGEKCGSAPPEMDWQTWLPNAIKVEQMYRLLHCIIHKTGGSRESYCRIVPEAYAAGVPVVVEDDYAFPDLVIDGVTGYRCKSSDEMSFRASELAFDEAKRKAMIFEARRFLVEEIASSKRCWAAWDAVL